MSYWMGDSHLRHISTRGEGTGVKILKFFCEHHLWMAPNTTRPRILRKLFVKADLSAQKERYTSKVMHSYY